MTNAILTSIEHYSRTGEILDDLLPYFRQSGRWVGDCRNWPKTTYRMASAVMHSAVLAESRRTAVNDQGEPILRTSFHWRKRRDVEIPWFEIAGSIKVKSLETISAPNLRSVGGYIFSCSDSEVCLPNLLRVGGDLDFQGTRKLHVPQLTEVGGSLLVIECDLPNLEMVGNRFWGIWTGPLFVPKLRSVGGSFEIGMAESVIAPALEWVCFDIVVARRANREGSERDKMGRLYVSYCAREVGFRIRSGSRPPKRGLRRRPGGPRAEPGGFRRWWYSR